MQYKNNFNEISNTEYSFNNKNITKENIIENLNIHNKVLEEEMLLLYSNFTKYAIINSNIQDINKTELRDLINKWYREIYSTGRIDSILKKIDISEYNKYRRELFYKIEIDRQFKDTIYTSFYYFHILKEEDTKDLDRDNLLILINSPYAKR